MICWLLHERDAVSFRFGLSCMCSTYLWMPLLLKCIFMGLKMTFSSERLYDVNVLEVGCRYFKTWFYNYFRFASRIIIDIHELFFLQIYLSSKSLHFSVWSIRPCYIWRSSKTASIQKENTSLIRWVWWGNSWFSYSCLQNTFWILLTIVCFHCLPKNGLGAHGVGRRHIKNTLITKHPDRFAYPIPRKLCLSLKCIVFLVLV